MQELENMESLSLSGAAFDFCAMCEVTVVKNA